MGRAPIFAGGEGAASLVVAGVGYGAEKAFEAYFQDVAREVARQFLTQGAESFSHVYARASSRIPYLLKDPRGWEEFRAQAQTRPSGPFALSLESRHSLMSPLDRWWERNMPMWWAGWPTWLRARRRELRERWFWLVTLRDYSGAPPVAK